jgi:PGF-pre-PGF domain-containing protein
MSQADLSMYLSQEVNIISPSKNVTVHLDNGTNITLIDSNDILTDFGVSKNITVNSWDKLPINADLGVNRFAGENLSVEINCNIPSLDLESDLETRIIPDAHLRFNYSESKLKDLGIIDETDELKLIVKYYDNFTKQWKDANITNRTPSENYLIVNTNHFTFFVLAIPAAAAASISTSYSSGSGGTGNEGIISKEPVDNIEKYETKSSYIAKDIPTTYKFNSQKGIYEIIITSKNMGGDKLLRLEHLKGLSKIITESAPDIVYYYANVWGIESGITESLFRFKVENSWITSSNIESLKMVKWGGSKWEGLETRQINKDDVFTYFEARSNGLSQLAVVGVKASVPPVTQEVANVSLVIPPTVASTPVQAGEPFKINFNYILGLFVIILVASIFIIAARTTKTPTSQEFIAKSREEYGVKYQEHLLEQYKVYVKIADKISERRQSANNSFLIFDSILISVFGILSGIESMARHHMWQYLIPLAGLLVSITWSTLISSSRHLQSIKLASIEKMESELPVALFNSEWKNSGEGKARQYLVFNYIEQFVPWIFTGIYIVLIVIILWNL